MKFFKVFVAAASMLLIASCGKSGGGNTPTPTKFSVTFDYNYEGAPAALVVEVEKGEKVEKPADPAEREGFKFMGWYKSKTSTDEAFKFDFDQEIYQDYKVYAGWGEVTLQHWCVVGSFQDWDKDAAPEMETTDYENYTYTFNCPAGTNFKVIKDHEWDVQVKYQQVDLEHSDVEALGIEGNELGSNDNIHITNAAKVKLDYNPFENVLKITKAGELVLVVTGYTVNWKGSFNGWTSVALAPTEPQLTGTFKTEKVLLTNTDDFGFTLDTYYDDGSSVRNIWFAADNVKFNNEHIDDAGGNYKVKDTGKYVLAITIDAEGAITAAVDSFEEVVLTPDHYNFYLAGSVAGWGVNEMYVFEAQNGAKLEGTWKLVAELAEGEEVQPINTISYVEGGASSVNWMGTGAENLPAGITAGGNYVCGTAGNYLFTIVVAGTTMTVTISAVA